MSDAPVDEEPPEDGLEDDRGGETSEGSVPPDRDPNPPFVDTF